MIYIDPEILSLFSVNKLVSKPLLLQKFSDGIRAVFVSKTIFNQPAIITCFSLLGIIMITHRHFGKLNLQES